MIFLPFLRRPPGERVCTWNECACSFECIPCRWYTAALLVLHIGHRWQSGCWFMHGNQSVWFGRFFIVSIFTGSARVRTMPRLAAMHFILRISSSARVSSHCCTYLDAENEIYFHARQWNCLQLLLFPLSHSSSRALAYVPAHKVGMRACFGEDRRKMMKLFNLYRRSVVREKWTRKKFVTKTVFSLA